MTFVSFNERERVRDRARPRPNAPGNYITNTRFATVISLTLDLTPENYVKWWPYAFPETKAIGYIDNPTPTPAWIPVGPVNVVDPVLNIANSLIPGQTGFTVPPVVIPDFGVPIPALPNIASPQPINIAIPSILPSPPTQIPDGSTLTADSAHRAGNTFTAFVGVNAIQINPSKRPIRGITILAASTNTGTVFIGYNPQVTIDNAFPLVAGSAKDLNIDNLSDLWLIADAAAQKIHVEYTI